MIFRLEDLRSDFAGFSQLVRLSESLEDEAFADIDIDLGSVRWLDANMCAPLGAILYRIGRNLNEVRILESSNPVEQALTRNGFLSNYGRARRPDTFGTTIPYMRFETKDERYFGEYVCVHLLSNRLPVMSTGLRKKFQESIFEIFSNAVIHSGTKLGIYSCGQFFPRKQRLDFCVVDLGVGIGENVRAKLNQLVSATEAIKWALTGKNTTKSGPVPGGLGLKLLTEFAGHNGGKVQIVSSDGYYELSPSGEQFSRLPAGFPGTVVNLEFNTADTKTYCLVSELDSGSIF